MNLWRIGLMAAPFALLANSAQGGDGDRPWGPNPAVVFQFLDADRDGAIDENEIPDDAPPPLKFLLRAADRNDDDRVTLPEWRATADELPPPPFPFVPPFLRNATIDGNFPPKGLPFGPPDPKVVFDEFDVDQDGRLSRKEFEMGAKRVREQLARQFADGMMPPPPFVSRTPGRSVDADRASSAADRDASIEERLHDLETELKKLKAEWKRTR